MKWNNNLIMYVF